MDDLSLKITLDVRDAFKVIDDLQSKLDKLLKGNGGGGGKIPAPKVDTSSFKAYQNLLGTASTLTTRLGRELDALTKQYGANSKEVKNFVATQLESNKVKNFQLQALAQLKNAYQQGLVPVEKYRRETEKLINTQQLFQNKLKGATLPRQISADLNEISKVISTLSPKLGGMFGQIAQIRNMFKETLQGNNPNIMGSLAPNAVSKAKLEEYRQAILATGAAGETAAGGLGAFNLSAGAMTAVIGGTIVAVAGLTAGIGALFTMSTKAQAEFQKNQNTLSTLLTVTNQYYDATGKKLEIVDNFKAAQVEAKKLAKILDVEAARVAGVERGDLDKLLAIAGSQISKATGGNTQKIGKLTSGIAASLAPLGLLDEVQMRQESRALFSDDIKPGSRLAESIIANQFGGSEKQFVKLRDEAIKAGKGFEFFYGEVEKGKKGVLSDFITASDQLAASFDNNLSIMRSGIDMFFRDMGEKTLPVLDKMVQKVGGLFVEKEGPNQGQLNQETQELAAGVGTAVGSLVNSLTPALEPLLGFLIKISEAIIYITNLLSPFLAAFASVSGVFLAIGGNLLDLVIPALSVLSDLATILTNGITMLADSFIGWIGSLNLTTAALGELGEYIILFRKAIRLMTTDFQGGLQAMGQVALAVTNSIASFFQNLAARALSFIAQMVTKGSAMLQGFLGQFGFIGKAAGAVAGALGGKAGDTLKGWSESFKAAGAASGVKALGFKMSAQNMLAGVSLGSSNVTSKGGFGGDDSEKKGKQGKSQDALDRQEDQAKQRKEKIKDAQEELKLAEQELEKTIQLNEAKDKLLETELKINAAKNDSFEKLDSLDRQKAALDIQQKQVEASRKRKEISEQEKITQLAAIDAQRIEIQYQEEITNLKTEQLAIDKQKNDLNELINNEAAKEAEQLRKIQEAQAELNRNKALLADTKTGKEKDEIELKIVQLNKTITELKKTLNDIQSESARKIKVAESNIDEAKESLQNKYKAAEREKDQGLSLNSTDLANDIQEEQNKTNQSILDTFKDAGSGLIKDIIGAFKDGGGNAGEKILAAFESFGNKIFDKLLDTGLNKLFNKDGNSGGGGFGNFFKGLFGGKKSSGGGGWDGGIFDKATNQWTDLAGNLIGNPNDKSGGGLAGGLSGLLGAAGPWGAVAGAAISIIPGFIKSIFGKKKKKKQQRMEKYVKKQMRELENTMTMLDFFIEDREREVETSLKNLKKTLDSFNRVIKKMDLSKSIYNISKAIKKTEEGLTAISKTLGSGQAVTFVRGVQDYGKYSGLSATIGNMQTLMKAINDPKASGLYAQRNKQIKELVNQYNFLTSRLGEYGNMKGSKIRDLINATLDQRQNIVKQIQSVIDSFNDKIDGLDDQSQEYQDQIEEYIKNQKEMIKNFQDQVQKQKSENMFGQLGSDLFDTVNGFVTNLREMLMSGFNPEDVGILVEGQLSKLKENAKAKAQEMTAAIEDFANKVLDLNEELFGVLSEGRVTGKVKKTQKDKIQDIAARLDAAYKEQQNVANTQLGQFGDGLQTANKALEYFSNLLKEQASKAIEDAYAGKTAIDGIQVTVNDPRLIADAVQKILNSRLSVDGYLRAGLV